MKPFLLLALFFIGIPAFGQIDKYLEEFRLTGQSNLKKENELLVDARADLPLLLQPFLKDSLRSFRQKAYSFIYRKGLQVPASQKYLFVSALLKGCTDPDGSVVGQILIWLQSFGSEAFSPETVDMFESYLLNRRMPHRKRMIMLAGYVGAGREWMRKQVMQNDLPPAERWAVQLALARMGDDASIFACAETLRSMVLNNQLVEYVLPDIIYTRQRELLNICVEYIQSDEMACISADPDYETEMLCGYRVLELLAPVIVDFPIKVSAIGSLDTDDYHKALLTARSWFLNHPNYKIYTNAY
ncbi:hypothetical protein [Alkaliflexus imshenetskii]|uniref:hypothetical protein n=1 Tax=Alkaliflexus imshenetskii TaxID=286730 RepID=UPI00047A256F|nr:hypothetical protein [Alkaliflexus imshenetskii]